MGPRIPPATSVRHTPRASTSSFSWNSASAPSFASSKTRTAPRVTRTSARSTVSTSQCRRKNAAGWESVVARCEAGGVGRTGVGVADLEAVEEEEHLRGRHQREGGRPQGQQRRCEEAVCGVSCRIRCGLRCGLGCCGGGSFSSGLSWSGVGLNCNDRYGGGNEDGAGDVGDPLGGGVGVVLGETASEQQVHTVRRVGELREARERCAVVHEVVAMGKEEA